MKVSRGIIADPPSGSSVSNSHTYTIVSNRFCKGGGEITKDVLPLPPPPSQLPESVAKLWPGNNGGWLIWFEPVTMIHRFEFESSWIKYGSVSRDLRAAGSITTRLSREISRVSSFIPGEKKFNQNVFPFPSRETKSNKSTATVPFSTIEFFRW